MIDASKLVNVYIKIRDARAELAIRQEAEMKELDDQLDLIGQQLLEICKTTGQEGGKTPYGSFTKTVKTRYWTSDWESMYQFIRENDGLKLLEQRVHQGNFKEFLKNNPDRMPAGMNVESKYSVIVRRATKN